MSKSKDSHFIQGKFIPQRPHKYVGDPNNIFYRSSWELVFMKWCDNTKNVRRWANEEIAIPYFNPIKDRPARYFPDFWIEIVGRKNKIRRVLIEIKPEAETRPPVLTLTESTKKPTKKYIQSAMVFAVNEAKWQAATKFCSENNMEFLIMTEYDLGIKTK